MVRGFASIVSTARNVRGTAVSQSQRKNKGPYVVGEKCTRQCSLHPDNLDFAEVTTGWYNEDWTIEQMVIASEGLGRKLSTAALSRHRRHLVEAEEESEIPLTGGGVADDIAVLRAIVRQGAKRAHLWRVGPADTMKAIDMIYKLTQGSVVGDLLDALMADDMDDEEDEEGVVDVGSVSPVEQESADAAEG